MYQVLYLIFYKLLETLFFSDIRSMTSEGLLQSWTKFCSCVSYVSIIIVFVVILIGIRNELRSISYKLNFRNKE